MVGMHRKLCTRMVLLRPTLTVSSLVYSLLASDFRPPCDRQSDTVTFTACAPVAAQHPKHTDQSAANCGHQMADAAPVKATDETTATIIVIGRTRASTGQNRHAPQTSSSSTTAPAQSRVAPMLPNSLVLRPLHIKGTLSRWQDPACMHGGCETYHNVCHAISIPRTHTHSVARPMLGPNQSNGSVAAAFSSVMMRTAHNQVGLRNG